MIPTTTSPHGTVQSLGSHRPTFLSRGTWGTLGGGLCRPDGVDFRDLPSGHPCFGSFFTGGCDGFRIKPVGVTSTRASR